MKMPLLDENAYQSFVLGEVGRPRNSLCAHSVEHSLQFRRQEKYKEEESHSDPLVESIAQIRCEDYNNSTRDSIAYPLKAWVKHQ